MSNDKQARLWMPALVASMFLLCAILFSVTLLPSRLSSSQRDYYHAYANAISNGRLWVTEAVDSRCPVDMAEYGGKCYLYWGIPPALFHWALPFASDRVFTILLSTIAIFFLARWMLEMAYTLSPRPSPLLMMPLLIFLALGTGLLAGALCGYIYTEAVAFALAFGIAGLFFLWDKKFLPAAILIAAASLCRPSWFLLGVFAAVWVSARPLSKAQKIVFALPLIAAMGIQGLLNWMRFDNVFEFGRYFEVVSLTDRAFDFTRDNIGNLPRNLMMYFFGGLPAYPDHRTGKVAYWAWSEWFVGKRPFENALGLFLVYPALMIGFFEIPKLLRERKFNLFAFAAICLSLAYPVLINHAQSCRYLVEVWLWLLVVLVPTTMTRRAGPLEISAHWLSLTLTFALSLMMTYVFVIGRLQLGEL